MSATSGPVLRIEGLTKRYRRPKDRAGDPVLTGERAKNIDPATGDVLAVRDVNLAVYPGEILGIMGESGSGKSTLLRLINRAEEPDAGRIVFHDGSREHELTAMNAAEARRVRDRCFGVVHQNAHLGLNFGISAGGNIAERLLMAGTRSYAQIRRRAAELIQAVQVPLSRMDESPRTFSGGMQQRVQIAKALATNPRLLLLDEVTTGLDLSVQARILDLILQLHADLRLTILLVTHDIGVVKLLARRMIVMRDGMVVESGLTDQVLQDPQHPYSQELVGAAL